MRRLILASLLLASIQLSGCASPSELMKMSPEECAFWWGVQCSTAHTWVLKRCDRDRATGNPESMKCKTHRDWDVAQEAARSRMQ